MKNKLLVILFLLLPLFGISQESSPAPQATSDTSQLDKLWKEFVEFDLLFEIFEVRDLSNVDKSIPLMEEGNDALKEFFEYFNEKKQVGVKIKSYVDIKHLWSVVNKKDNYQGVDDRTDAVYLTVDVVLTPQERVKGKGFKHNLSIKITPSDNLLASQKFTQEQYDAMNAFLKDSIGTEIIGPTKDRLNSAVIGALMILAGATDYPVNATLVPTNAIAEDKIPNIALQNQYHSIVINGKQQILPWYSVKAGTKFDVNATIQKMLIDTLAKPVRITGTNGYMTELTTADSAVSLALPPMSEGEYTLTANLSNQGFEVPLASFDIAAYNEKKEKVVLIALGLNSDQKNNLKKLEDSLNKLYEQAVIKWTVMFDESFTYEAFKNQIEVGNNSFFSNYSSQMNDIIKAYKNKSGVTIEKNTYYVFIVPTFSQTRVVGYMPMKRQFGFVALPDNLGYAGRILAHELGHGAFCLEHPEKEYGVTLNYNLMSEQSSMYETGWAKKKLAKYQWDQAHNPPSGMYLFQEEEDVMEVLLTSSEELKIIQLGLKPEERNYVKMNKDGMIDVAEMEDGLKKLKSISDNYYALYLLVKSDEITEVKIGNKIVYKAYSKDIENLPFKKSMKIVDEIWISQGGKEDFSGLLQFVGRDWHYHEFVDYWKKQGVENVADEKDVGYLGMTLYSINYKPNKEYPYYSTNENNQIYISIFLSEKNQVILFAHEAYGHALFKILKKNSSHGQSRIQGGEDYNEEIETQIINRQNEAETNYDK